VSPVLPGAIFVKQLGGEVNLLFRTFGFYGALVFSVTAGGIALADDCGCKLTGRGEGFRRVVDQGQGWTYELKSSGPNWRIGPGDRHVQGRIFCESCGWGSTSPTGAGGDFAWGIHTYHNWRPPSTAAERAAARKEQINGDPIIPLRANRLEVRAAREPISLGPLSGYAILYRMALPHLPQENKLPALLEGSFLVVYLKDTCIEFEALLRGKPSTDGDDWRPLESLLNELTITKSPSAEADIPKKDNEKSDCTS
jgi:hypothetical protein